MLSSGECLTWCYKAGSSKLMMEALVDWEGSTSEFLPEHLLKISCPSWFSFPLPTFFRSPSDKGFFIQSGINSAYHSLLGILIVTTLI